MNKDDIKKIAQIAIDIDHKYAFGGKSVGNEHLSRVVKIAKFLGEKLNANMDVVEVAAYLHDAALPTENDDDYVENKKLIEKILFDSGVVADEYFVRQVAEAAASHEGVVLPKTLEAKIVHDADVIEKTGLLGVIRHTWKMTNHRKINSNNISDEDIKTIIEHINWRKSILQTEIAQRMAEENSIYLTINKLREIVPVISSLASEGVITEKIALEIEKFLDESQIKSLKSQLNLDYLK